MARAVITPVKLSKWNEINSADLAFTALNGTDGGEIVWDGRDIDGLILVKNSDDTNAETFTIKKGNSEQAVVDFTYSIPKLETRALAIESAFFKNVTGTDKGKVVVSGSADLSVAVVFLP